MRRTVISLLGVYVVILLASGCSDMSTNTTRDRSGNTSPQAAGDLIGNVALPVSGFGVSVAVGCEGTVYYTLSGSNNLYAMNKTGVLLSTTPVTDVATHAPLEMDEMAWDSSRNLLWAQLHASNPVSVYTVDPATGLATLQFVSQTTSAGVFRDGLAYDGTDGTIWISGDISDTIEHYSVTGTFLGQITPKNSGGGTLGDISGVCVGVGDLLYLGRDGFAEIVQVRKSNGDFIGSFASPGGARDEGLECDPVNFAPKLALWSREFNSPGFMSVIELEPGTCACGGASGDIEVALDIHPTSCPNPINLNSRGVTPAAILGTATFDVTKIDVSTVKLEGVAPIRSNVSDVATPYTPFTGREECKDCNNLGPDGYPDLTLKFSTPGLAAALQGQEGCVVLHLTGNLKAEFGGTAIVGEDVVKIISLPQPAPGN